ncbi:MAG: hypothetical protein Q4D12_02825 [Bacteroidales bacterium]|nr:hypothetical protein [Bacteroidales bacterium]
MKKIIFAALMMLVAVGANAQEKKYSLKSGSVKFAAKIMEMEVTVTQYFDDYGQKESTITEQGGANIMQMTKGDQVLVWIMGTTTGMKQDLTSKPINYLNLTDDLIDKFQIIQLDEKQTVLGKECIGYNMMLEANGAPVQITTWVWEGLPLKVVQVVAGSEVVQEAVELKENVEIEPDKFIIPDDVVFQTIQQ